MEWRWAWQVGVSSAADGAATTGVVTGMHTHAPLFARAHGCPCLSMPVHIVIHPQVVAGMHVYTCAPLFCLCLCLPCSSMSVQAVVRLHGCEGRHAHTCTIVCLYMLPFICARLHLFAGPHLSLAVCVCSVVLVPTIWLSLFGFCLCLGACWCSLGFVCAGSAFVHAHLGLFML